jgi:type III restriction enzyme
MKPVNIQFDRNQAHQRVAMDSVVRLFSGLFHSDSGAYELSDEIIPNLPPYYQLDAGWLEENLVAVRADAGLGETLGIAQDSGFMLEGISVDTWEYPTFTVDMETGTGKTYVYLRTIHELFKEYGLRKFLIVVPSVAIYEGVIKTIKDTRSHFASIYGTQNVVTYEYDGAKPQLLRNFAIGRAIEIMVITIDSFNKKSNTIFKKTDKLMGQRMPYEYLQETRPILILDESQNYQSEKSRAALRTLKPLLAINYSATPGREAPNLVCRLTPFDAFQQHLVKKIEVLGLIEAQSIGIAQDYLRLLSIATRSRQLVACFEAMVQGKDGLQLEQVELTNRTSLAVVCRNPAYEGWAVEEIDSKDGYVQFGNGERFLIADERLLGLKKEALFKRQIEETIRVHMEKQKELKAQGVKVLSLFFIDRVASYVPEDSVIKRLFDEAFNRLKKSYPDFASYQAKEVREGYFARKKATKKEPETFVDAAPDEEAEKRAFDLIMRRKGQLLSFDEPVSFIFAHSALREGWDNPNVFQICALREIVSENQRRQTIGRGLRLPVMQDGIRLQDRRLNVLTVIANESYANYVERLQKEYADSGDMLPALPTNHADKETARRNAGVYSSRDFSNFWNKLIQTSEYTISIETPSLVQTCIQRLNNASFPEPTIVITRGRYVVTTYRLELLSVGSMVATLRLSKEDSTGNRETSEHEVGIGTDLSKVMKDPVLKPFSITSISGQGETAAVEFSEGGVLTRDKAIIFASEKGQVVSSRREAETVKDLPKFNLIERTSREVSLTRQTVLEIFRGLKAGHKRAFLSNPEGFTAAFIGIIKDCLADHIADKLEYRVNEEILVKGREDFFPEEKRFPVKELIAGNGNSSLYDLVQVDSDNERRFVERMNRETAEEKVVLYFKFPGSYKIRIPRIIGNYNPDWGILRWNDQHRLKLELVRETKGNLDLAMLQHSNEGRKVRCARKHFAGLGVSYRHITGDTTDWWKEEVREEDGRY